MQCCVFLLGISAGTYLPSGITTVTSLVNSKDWGKAVGIYELAPNLSFILTPLLVAVLLHWFFWRHILFFIGTGSVIAGIAFARFGKGGHFLGTSTEFFCNQNNFKGTQFLDPDFFIQFGHYQHTPGASVSPES
jgi:MFS family permease